MPPLEEIHVIILLVFFVLAGGIGFFFGRSSGRGEGRYYGKNECRKEWEKLHIEEDVHWLREEIKDHIKNDSLEEVENSLKGYSEFVSDI